MYDIAVIGGGILGICVTTWLKELFDGNIVIVDKEPNLASHTTTRNTGIIHRPFYLNPHKKRNFARAAQTSYFLWKDWAEKKKLPWKQVGTLEVATEPEQIPILKHYLQWAKANHMQESELEVLDSKNVTRIEPEVKCEAALHCKTDASVSYSAFAYSLLDELRARNVNILTNAKVTGLREIDRGIEVSLKNHGKPVLAKYVVNCAGGSSLDLAKMLGLADEYVDLHFRGEYWHVSQSFGERVSRNVYSVPKRQEFPFLDPHLIFRADGRREIGPNAVLVAGPNTYRGVARGPSELVSKILERPWTPKLRLFSNTEFLSLVSQEWRSSLFISEMCKRVQRFIPSLTTSKLVSKGLAGVRSNAVNRNGFVPEAIELETHFSYHILNYNSPGATGAPAYAAYTVSRLRDQGYLDHLKKKDGNTIWSLDFVLDQFKS